MSKTELLEKLSKAIPDDANVTFATATWWNDEGTFNWDSDSDEVT